MAKELDFSKGSRGPVLPMHGKTRITIYIDDDVLDAFRDRAEAEGRGYQTAMNEALRRSLATGASPHEALLSRLQNAIAGVLEGVRIVDAQSRPVAKRAPVARKTGADTPPTRRARKQATRKR